MDVNKSRRIADEHRAVEARLAIDPLSTILKRWLSIIAVSRSRQRPHHGCADEETSDEPACQ
jgi:hypothetical protein